MTLPPKTTEVSASAPTIAGAAAAHHDRELAAYRSPREWWRVPTLPDGEPVGFVTPARNAYTPIIGYIAMLPEHRGNGYIDELLAEGTQSWQPKTCRASVRRPTC